jgi:hypothetical protein
MKNDNKNKNDDVNFDEILKDLNHNTRSKLGIGNYVQFELLNPIINKDNWLKTNQEIVDLVLEKFPSAKTTTKCIAWYKSNIKKQMLNKNDKFLEMLKDKTLYQ